MPTGSSTEVSDSARRASRAASGLVSGVSAPFAGHPGAAHCIIGIGGYPPTGATGAGCCSGMRPSVLVGRAAATAPRRNRSGRIRVAVAGSGP